MPPPATVSHLIATAVELLDQHRRLRADLVEQRRQLRHAHSDTEWRRLGLWAIGSTLPLSWVPERRCPSCLHEIRILEFTSADAPVVYYRCPKCEEVWGRDTLDGQLIR